MENNSFLSDFLMITDIRTIVFIFVLIGIFIFIKKLENNKVKFSTRTITGMIIGLVLGCVIQFAAGAPDDPSKVNWLNEVSKWYSLFGTGFVILLKMLVVPLVFVSILKVIIDMGEDKNLSKITIRTIAMLLITTALSAIVAIMVGNFMNINAGMENLSASAEMREISPLVDTFLGLLPENPVQAMFNSNMVAVIIFAAFIGIAAKRQSKKYLSIVKPFIDLVEAFHKIIVSVAMTIIKFMPYAVAAMLANTITAKGIKSMFSVIEFIITLYICVVIVFLIHLLILLFIGVNPIKYLKNSVEQLIMAFTSRSSLGTLPITIETLNKKQGVEEGIASLTGSLGSNMGMNGCAGIYPALMTIALANSAGIDMDLSFYITLVIVIAISSLGIAGIPGSATMAVSVVISGVGLGEYFPLAAGILAIDPILDMGRTMLNVNGTSITSIVVAKSLGKLDKEIFNK